MPTTNTNRKEDDGTVYGNTGMYIMVYDRATINIVPGMLLLRIHRPALNSACAYNMFQKKFFCFLCFLVQRATRADSSAYLAALLLDFIGTTPHTQTAFVHR